MYLQGIRHFFWQCGHCLCVCNQGAFADNCADAVDRVLIIFNLTHKGNVQSIKSGMCYLVSHYQLKADRIHEIIRIHLRLVMALIQP